MRAHLPGLFYGSSLERSRDHRRARRRLDRHPATGHRRRHRGAAVAVQLEVRAAEDVGGAGTELDVVEQEQKLESGANILDLDLQLALATLRLELRLAVRAAEWTVHGGAEGDDDERDVGALTARAGGRGRIARARRVVGRRRAGAGGERGDGDRGRGD